MSGEAQSRPGRAGEEADDGARAARGVGLPAPEGAEDRVARILLGPHHGKAARVREEVILHVVVPGVAAAEVPDVVVLLGAAGRGAVGVGAADEAHHEGVDTACRSSNSPSLRALRTMLRRANFSSGTVGALRAHHAVYGPQHLEVVSGDLFEVALLVDGVEALPRRRS